MKGRCLPLAKMASAKDDDLERLFRPILICFRLTGIQLIPCRFHRWIWLFGWAMLACTTAEVVFSWILAIEYMNRERSEAEQSNLTTTTSLSYLVLLGSHHMWTLGTQIALSIMAAWNSERLWTVLLKSFTLANRPLAHYQKLRLLSAVVLFAMLGVSVKSKGW